MGTIPACIRSTWCAGGWTGAMLWASDQRARGKVGTTSVHTPTHIHNITLNHQSPFFFLASIHGSPSPHFYPNFCLTSEQSHPVQSHPHFLATRDSAEGVLEGLM